LFGPGALSEEARWEIGLACSRKSRRVLEL
jgi:hypothetical protein